MRAENAHFLHEKKGLTGVLSPPIERPRALAWIGRTERLLVATEAGELVEVDPVMGTRVLGESTHDPAALAVSPDGQHFAVVERARGVAVHRCSDGERLASVSLPLLSDIAVCWFELGENHYGVAVAGDDLDGRRAVIMTPDLGRRRIAKVPRRTAIGAGRKLGLLYARVTAEGLHVASFGQPLPPGDPSKHRLRIADGGVIVGVAEGGVTIWRGPSVPPVTIMVYDVSAAALGVDGTRVAVGTRSGEVAFCPVEGGSLMRARPGKVGGHSSAVRAIAFSRRGRWLATAAEELRIWTW